MQLQNPFTALINGLESQVLNVLCRSENLYSLTEILQLAPENSSRTGARKAIERLVEQGLVEQFALANSYMYRLNREHLLAPAVLEIARAKSLLIERLKTEIESWALKPITVILFGSAARDEMGAGSDIDLLIVWDNDSDEDAAFALSSDLSNKGSTWTGNDLRVLEYTADEIAPSVIFSEILSDGIPVYGDPAWLRRTVRKLELSR